MPAAQTIAAMTLQRQQAMGAHLAKKTPARVLAFMTALRAKFSFFPTSEVLMTRAPWDLQAGGQQRVRLEGVEAGAPHLVCLHPADNARSGYRKQEREGEANPRAEANQGLVGTKTQARHESAAPYASALAHLHHRMHSMIFDVRPQPVESSALQARMPALQETPVTPSPLLPTCSHSSSRHGQSAQQKQDGTNPSAPMHHPNDSHASTWGSGGGGCSTGQAHAARQPHSLCQSLTAPMMPATWVPCPLSSMFFACQAVGMAARLATRSGWLYCRRRAVQR